MVNQNQLQQFTGRYSKSALNNIGIRMNKELGEMAPVIAIEELSELIQATSKYMRFDMNSKNTYKRYSNDRINLLEELADACIGIQIIKSMARIKQEELDQMIEYKVDRKNKFISDGSIINGKGKQLKGRKR